MVTRERDGVELRNVEILGRRHGGVLVIEVRALGDEPVGDGAAAA